MIRTSHKNSRELRHVLLRVKDIKAYTLDNCFIGELRNREQLQSWYRSGKHGIKVREHDGEYVFRLHDNCWLCAHV